MRRKRLDERAFLLRHLGIRTNLAQSVSGGAEEQVRAPAP